MNDSETLKVLLFSDDRLVRQEVRLALGSKVARDLPPVEVFEVATGPALLRALDVSTDYDIVILDGNAQPEGGFGLSYQMKDEYADAPPTLLLVSRVADAWLATWSRAEAISVLPVDAFTLPNQVAEVVRKRRAVTA